MYASLKPQVAHVNSKDKIIHDKLTLIILPKYDNTQQNDENFYCKLLTLVLFTCLSWKADEF